MANSEIATVHFVLPCHTTILSRCILMKTWMLNNPSKKAIIWFDSLAMDVASYFDKVVGDLVQDSKLNDVQKLNKFREIMFEKEFRFIENFGGDALWKSVFTDYKNRFNETYLDVKAPKINKPENKVFIQKMFDDIEKEMFSKNILKTYMKSNLASFFKVNETIGDSIETNFAIDNMIVANREILVAKRRVIDHKKMKLTYQELIKTSLNMPKDFTGTFEINDFYQFAADNSFDKTLMSLYHFEILCNRDVTLARNLSMYMIAEKYRSDLVMRADMTPNRIGDQFQSIGTIDRSKIYTSFNTKEAALNYQIFPTEANINIKECLSDMGLKRFKQIQLFSLKIIESQLHARIGKQIDMRDTIKQKFKDLVNEFHKKFLGTYGILGAENIRRVQGNISNYQNHIFEITGEQFWVEEGVTLEKLSFINHFWPEPVKKPVQTLVEQIQDNRMSSEFGLELFIYMHSGEDYLTYTRYPSYNKKAILFYYDENLSDIKFMESGIIFNLGSGDRLEEANITDHVKNIIIAHKKVRIQVMGHSMQEIEGKEQTVGKTNVEQFSSLFNKWFNKYLKDVSVDRLVFISCQLAKFKDVEKIEELKVLPQGNFIEKFIKNFRSNGINIKQITASDKVLRNEVLTGRIIREKNQAEQQEKKAGTDDLKKLVINTEKPFMDSDGMLRYKCLAITENTDLTSNDIQSNSFRFSDNIFEASSALGHQEVLQVPLQADSVSHEIVKFSRPNNDGNVVIEAANVVALMACAQDNRGKILIIDTLPERIEGVRLALRMALISPDYVHWKTSMQNLFPNAYEHLASYITADNFNIILNNILSKRIIFANCDLTRSAMAGNIRNCLEMETGTSSPALIYTSTQENDISTQVAITQMEEGRLSIRNEHFTETVPIIEKIQSASESFRENMKALMDNESILLRTDYNDNSIRLLDRSQIDIEWPIRSITPLEIVSNEVVLAENFAETYHMAAELHNAYQLILDSKLNELTPNHVPLFDTIMDVGNGAEKIWSIVCIDSANPDLPAITIETKSPIFKRVSSYIKKYSNMEKISTVGSTALNLIFGIQALCHWIQNGFKADIERISNKSLATAIEVHFYVNAVGITQGLAESVYSIGKFAISKSTVLVNALKPYVTVSMKLMSMSKHGTFLLNVAKYSTAALPVIGFIINGVDLALNIYELVNNDEPYQRPILITSTVFSAAGMVVSSAAIIAYILGASALAGPLGLIGLGIAGLGIAVNYLVANFTERIEGSKNIGLCIKNIIEEIKCGAYKKIDEHHFLTAPSFVPIEEMKLLSSAVEITFGEFRYFPTLNAKINHFTNWYHVDQKYAKKDNKNFAKIPIDDSIRTLVMPHVPRSHFQTDDGSIVSFSSFRNDAEFEAARDLQNKDPGFTFQTKGQIGFDDQIASKVYFDYFYTETHINIQESNWKLIFPWADTAKASDENERKGLEESNDGLISRLKKISYHLRTESIGRQCIQLPPLECPVNLHLNASNKDAIWYIEFYDSSISHKNFTIENDDIKIGEKQTIKIDGNAAKVFFAVPKYSDKDYSGMAYLDARQNKYIYNKDWKTEGQQKDVTFLFSTRTIAYFYKQNTTANGNPQNDSNIYAIYGVSIETKQAIGEINDVKSCQKHGENLVIITNQGIIYYMGEDPQSRKLISQIIGFADGWFNQNNSPSDALEAINVQLNKVSHGPMIHFYLPYSQNAFNVTMCDILFDTENHRYFIISAEYAINSSQPKYLLFDDISGGGFFYADNRKELIVFKGLNAHETSKKIQFIDGKVQVNANEPCVKILKGVLNASFSEHGIQVRLSSGLEIILKRSEKPNSPILIIIQKLILRDGFANQSDKRTSVALQEAVNRFQNENLRYSGKIEIIHPTYVAIEHNGKNIGFYEKIEQRTLCTTNLPEAHAIIPLGTDENFAYHILNHQQIYQSEYVTHLSEIRKQLDSKHRKSTTETRLFFNADVVTLFNRSIVLKAQSLQTDFQNVLKTVSTLPEIDFIYIESTEYTLNVDIYKNITIASIDLSHIDALTANIRIEMGNFEDYYFERQNDHLLLTSPRRNFSVVFTGVFKTETIVPFIKCVSLAISDDDVFVLNTPNTFVLPIFVEKYGKLVQPLSIFDQITYSKVSLVEMLKGVASSEEVVKIFETLLWPSDDKVKKIYGILEWLSKYDKKEKSKYLLGYLEDYTDAFDKVLKQKNQQNSLLHFAVRDGKSSVIQVLCENKASATIKELVLIENQESKTALHFAGQSRDLQSVQTLCENVEKYAGKETLKELIFKTDKNGCNAIHTAIYNNSPQAFLILMGIIKKHFTNDLLEELIQKNENDGNTCLHYAALYGNAKTMSTFLTFIKEHFKKESRKEIMLKTNNTNQTALSILASKEHSDSIIILLSDVNELFDKIPFVVKSSQDDGNVNDSIAFYGNPDILKAFFDEKKKHNDTEKLKKTILGIDQSEHNALHILVSKDQPESIRILCAEVITIFGKETFREIVMRATDETENVLEFAICQNKLKSFETLLAEIQTNLGNDTLNELLNSKEMPFFHYVTECRHIESFMTYCDVIKKYFDEKTLQEMILKTDSMGQTIFHILIYNEQSNYIWILQEQINQVFTNEIFEALLLKRSTLGESFLHYIITYCNCETIKKFIIAMKEHLQPEILTKVIMIKNNAGDTVFHTLIFKRECDGILVLLEQTIELLEPKMLAEFVILSNSMGPNLLHHIAYNSNSEIIKIFWIQMKTYLDKNTLKEIVLKTDVFGESAIHILLRRNQSDSIQIIFKDLNELFGEETLNELVQKNGKNMLLHAAHNSNINTFKQFWIGIQTYLKQENVKTLIMATDEMGETILHILIANGYSESVQILLNDIKRFGEQTLKKMLMQIFNVNKENVLYFISVHGNAKLFAILWEGMKNIFKRETLKKIIFERFDDEQTLLHILILNNQSESILNLLNGIHEEFGKETLEELLQTGDVYEKNAIQYALSKESTKSLEILSKLTKEYLGKPVLLQVLVKQNRNGENAFQHAKTHCSNEMYHTLIQVAKKYIDIEDLNNLWAQGGV